MFLNHQYSSNPCSVLVVIVFLEESMMSCAHLTLIWEYTPKNTNIPNIHVIQRKNVNLRGNTPKNTNFPNNNVYLVISAFIRQFGFHFWTKLRKSRMGFPILGHLGSNIGLISEKVGWIFQFGFHFWTILRKHRMGIPNRTSKIHIIQ